MRVAVLAPGVSVPQQVFSCSVVLRLYIFDDLHTPEFVI